MNYQDLAEEVKKLLHALNIHTPAQHRAAAVVLQRLAEEQNALADAKERQERQQRTRKSALGKFPRALLRWFWFC